MNDINYSIDEAWTKLDKVNHTDKDEQTMNPNDRMQSQHQRRFMIQQIKSNLQHAMSTVKLLVELSRVFPNAFLNDGTYLINCAVHRDPLATMLNHFLELLLDRKHSPIIKLIKLENLEKQDFKLDHFLL
jgi:aspartyl/asparaginyl beta-hydroxylase (cupin superfamily)